MTDEKKNMLKRFYAKLMNPKAEDNAMGYKRFCEFVHEKLFISRWYMHAVMVLQECACFICSGQRMSGWMPKNWIEFSLVCCQKLLRERG